MCDATISVATGDVRRYRQRSDVGCRSFSRVQRGGENIDSAEEISIRQKGDTVKLIQEAVQFDRYETETAESVLSLKKGVTVGVTPLGV